MTPPGSSGHGRGRPDLGHGALHVAAFEPGRDGDILPRVFAPEFELAGVFLDVDCLR